MRIVTHGISPGIEDPLRQRELTPCSQNLNSGLKWIFADSGDFGIKPSFGRPVWGPRGPLRLYAGRPRWGGAILNLSKERTNMAVRKSEAEWKGDLLKGQGTMKLGSGAFEGSYSFPSRFESGQGTNPEELIAAAHAGCFSMALSAGLGKAGFTPTRIHTTATVHLEKVGEGFDITKIELDSEAQIPGIDNKTFLEHAEGAKKGCPVSKALAGPQITLTAKLV
jgi:osmotically inducible protein OsmC